jgi:SET family sugar efflux transporter-like MFS transporter
VAVLKIKECLFIEIRAIIDACLMSTASVYITNHLGASPLYISIFGVLSLFSNIIGQYIAKQMLRSEAIYTQYYVSCGWALVVGTLASAIFPGVWIYLLVHVPLVAIAQSWMIANTKYILQISGGCQSDLIWNSAAIRLLGSISWVVGPMLALMIVDRYGFTLLFLGLAIVTFLWIISASYLKFGGFAVRLDVAVPKGGSVAWACWQPAVVCATAVFAFNMIHAVNLSVGVASSEVVSLGELGFILSIKALAQIIASMLVPKICRYVSSTKLLSTSVLFGGIIFIGFSIASTFFELLVLSFLNGLCYGAFTVLLLPYLSIVLKMSDLSLARTLQLLTVAGAAVGGITAGLTVYVIDFSELFFGLGMSLIFFSAIFQLVPTSRRENGL